MKCKEPIIKALPFSRIYAHRKSTPLALIYARQNELKELRSTLKQHFARIGFSTLCGYFTPYKDKKKVAFLIYAIDLTFDLRAFLSTLGARFGFKFALYAQKDGCFKCLNLRTQSFTQKELKISIFNASGYLEYKSLLALSLLLGMLLKADFFVQGVDEETLLRILGLRENCIISFDIKRALWGFSGGVRCNVKYNYTNSTLKDLIFYLKKDVFESEYLG